MNLSDEELINQIISKKGEEKNYYFTLLYNKYLNFVYDLGRTMGIPRTEIDDFVQEVFTKLYQKISKFKQNKKFFPWFYSLVRNCCYDFLRKIKKHKLDSDLIIQNYTSNPYENDIETINTVRQIILELPVKEREVIFLKYYQELSIEEISQILNCSTRNVYNIINKAIAKLKEKLGEDIWQ